MKVEEITEVDLFDFLKQKIYSEIDNIESVHVEFKGTDFIDFKIIDNEGLTKRFTIQELL